MQILLPMAGNGSRFKELGYGLPKPLIDVAGRPMIDHVFDNLGRNNDFIVIVRRDHWTEHKDKFVEVFTRVPSLKVYVLDEATDGAARTCLKARHLIDESKPFMIANCDQLVVWDKDEFYRWFANGDYDAGIVVFESTNPAHSYVKCSDEGYIIGVAEKVVISNIATVGLYIWHKASDFFESAEEMIRRDIRTNGEFYVSPAFNIAIERDLKVRPYWVEDFIPLGTPEQLQRYLTTNQEAA